MLREDRGYTQKQVAKHMKVSKGYISQIELGYVSIPRHRVIIKMLEFYSISPKYFETILKDHK